MERWVVDGHLQVGGWVRSRKAKAGPRKPSLELHSIGTMHVRFLVHITKQLHFH